VLRAAAQDAAGRERKDRKRRDAEQRQRLRPLSRRIEKAEAAIAALQLRKKELEDRLAHAELYDAGRKDELKSVLEEQADVNWQLAREEADWLEAHEELERAG
jgi:ATP-binding cassette subfamily F protein 3